MSLREIFLKNPNPLIKREDGKLVGTKNYDDSLIYYYLIFENANNMCFKLGNTNIYEVFPKDFVSQYFICLSTFVKEALKVNKNVMFDTYREIRSYSILRILEHKTPCLYMFKGQYLSIFYDYEKERYFIKTNIDLNFHTSSFSDRVRNKEIYQSFERILK